MDRFMIVINNPLVINMCLNLGVVIGMKLLRNNKKSNCNSICKESIVIENEPFKVVLTGTNN